MKNLTLNLEEEICIIDKYGLTPNELLVIRVLLILQDDNQEELFQNLLIALKHINLPFRDILVQLQDKGIVLKSFKIPARGTSFDPYSIPINKNFIKNLYKSSFEMGKELFEAYPQFGNINGSVKIGCAVVIYYENPFNCWEHIFVKFFYILKFLVYICNINNKIN